MSKKSVLGKGLGALISDINEINRNGGGTIVPNYQEVEAPKAAEVTIFLLTYILLTKGLKRVCLHTYILPGKKYILQRIVLKQKEKREIFYLLFQLEKQKIIKRLI